MRREGQFARTIDESRPCVVVLVDDGGRLTVLQYLNGKLSASYAPRDLDFTLRRSLPQALGECVQAAAVNPASSDPA